MGVTPKHGIPWPAGTDPIAQGDDAIRSLAESLDGLIGPTVVTALPASPPDGKEVYYTADATAGVVWHLKYRAASTSAYKWEYVGGPPLAAEVVPQESTASTTYALLTTAGPTITPPLAGDYGVTLEAQVQSNTAATLNYLSYDIGAAGAVDADSALVNAAAASSRSYLGRTTRKAGLVAGAALVLKAKTSGGTLFVERRRFAITPVRVG
jgi:hypothetical protein